MATYPINWQDFNTGQALKTQRLCDYYEGQQLHHLIHMMEGKPGYIGGKREGWKIRGMVPRVRNITKAIVDKSGLLYSKTPQLLIKPVTVSANANAAPVTDETFNAIMESADWAEVFQNVDVYTRLTKTTVLLLQKYIPEETVTVNGQYKFDAKNNEALVMLILHQGNSVVRTNPTRTQVTALAYLIDPSQVPNYDASDDAEGTWYYRLMTPTEIIDFKVDETRNSAAKSKPNPAAQNSDESLEVVINRETNDDGFVPACFFHDVVKPRTGNWVRPPEDLLSLQEMLNLHLTDLEFAVAWQKQKTMVITGDLLIDKNNGPAVIPAAQPGFTPGGETWKDVQIYQQQQTSPLAVGGLGTIVKVGVDDNGNAGKVDFVGPNSDLKNLNDILSGIIEGVANDWDVSLDRGGRGAASSGFQLVVEEIDNLQLRAKRQQSAAAGMRRFYQILQQLYPGQLTDGELLVKFADPDLPVNQLEKEQIWQMRIADNRASRIDYFMTEQGMTQEEAEAKLQEVLDSNEEVDKAVAPAPAPGAPGGGATDPLAAAANQPQPIKTSTNPSNLGGIPNG